MVKEIKTLDEFSEKIGDEAFELVIIDFYATWCGPCKQIAPQIDDFSQKYKNVGFYKMDVDNEQLEQVCQILKITSLPTFCFFKKGNYVNRVVGADVGTLEKTIIAHISSQ